MKRLQLLLIFVGACGFLIFVKLATTVHPSGISLPRFEPSSIESREDPVARSQWEWMRLRDPQTNQIPRGIRAAELEYARTLPNAEALATSRLAKSEVLTWTPRGPANQGGRTRALAYDISDGTGNTILAGGVSGGMWRTTNGGASWARTTSLSDSVQTVTCLAQDPRVGNQNIWYYGTGEFLGNSARGGGSDAFYIGDGIYKSTNSGVSWQKLTSTASWTPQVFDKVSDIVWNIVVNPTNGNVYAALYGEVIRSTNGGSTWGAALAPTSTFSAYTEVAVTSGGVFYAVMSSDGSDGGIYRSTSGASGSWIDITPVSWPTTYNRTVLAVAPSNPNTVYFLSETPGSGHNDPTSGDWTSFWQYTYVSGDGSGVGGSWIDRSANLPATTAPVKGFSHQGGYDLVVKVKPDNANFVFIGGTNLYRSSDGFASSSNTAWIGGYSTSNDVSLYPNHHCDLHALAFQPGSPSILISGSDGGISKTTNDSTASVTWAFVNTGYVTSQFYSIAIDQATAGDPQVIGGMQDNGHLLTITANANAAWVNPFPNGGDGTITAIANGKTFYYTSTQNGSVYRLTLNGSGTYVTYACVQPSGASGFMFVTPYVLDANNSNIMYLAAGSQVWRNSDLSVITAFSQSTTATNWTGLTNTSVPGHNITALGISTNPANRLYFGTDSSRVFRLDGANAGSPTPTNITGVGFPASAYVSCIAVNPRNADTAIVVFSNYNVLSLFLTTDEGNSWANIGGNLEQFADGSGRGPSCRWATILPKPGAVQVYVGTSTGLYSTTSLSGTIVWALEGANTIGNEIVSMVTSRAVDGLVVAATHGNGVFSAQTVTGVQDDASPAPRHFELAQNFPNPFNPSTTIQYVVPRSGHVKLAVYDIAGKQIATLIEKQQVAGAYSSVWDGKSADGIAVASGVYFYRLEAAGFSVSKKMVLLK